MFRPQRLFGIACVGTTSAVAATCLTVGGAAAFDPKMKTPRDGVAFESEMPRDRKEAENDSLPPHLSLQHR